MKHFLVGLVAMLCVAGYGQTKNLTTPRAATSADNAVPRYDGTSGQLIQNSGVTISDANALTAATLNASGLTASRAVATDGSKNLVSSAATAAEQDFLSGVTSAIQTQLNAKGDFVGPASATDNAIVRFNGTTGKLGQNSGVEISDNNAINIANSTITANEPFFAVTNTWNNAGVTFTGIKANVVDTASASASLLMDLQVGGASKWRADKAGNTVQAGTLAVANGTASAAGIQFNSGGFPSYGLYYSSAILVTMGNIPTVSFGDSSGTIDTVKILNSGHFEWSSTSAATGTPDTFIGRNGAAQIELGLDAATATAQTIKAHDGSGTDKDGANLTLQGGQGTGTGRGGSFIVRTAPSGATGSSANAYSTREYQSAKAVTLTESTATTCLNVTLAAAKYIGIKVHATTFASDGTDHQATEDVFTVVAVNKGGTLTITGPTSITTSSAPSTGTLTTTWTAVANGATIDIKNNAVSSLTQTTLQAKWQVEINSNDAATVTPQ